MSAPMMDFKAWVRPELRELQPYASARAISGQIVSTVKLNANESPWPVDEATPLNRYPDPQPLALIEALADHWAIAPNQLLITRGSDEGIDLLIRLFARPSIDRVMVFPPCFGMYALYAQIQGAPVLEVPLIKGHRGWAMDWPSLQDQPPCRLYFLCSPNNPTGSLIPTTEIVSLAKQVQGQGLVVVDEAYAEFTDQASVMGLIEHQPNLVVLRTLSKAFGLAGARLGAVIAHPDLIAWLKRIIAPYPLPTPSIEAALVALQPDALAKQASHIERLKANKERLCQALVDWPWVKTLWPGEANFVLIEVDDAAAVMNHCLSLGIELRNQSHQPKLDQCIRITVGTEDETDQLLACLACYAPQAKS